MRSKNNNDRELNDSKKEEIWKDSQQQNRIEHLRTEKKSQRKVDKNGEILGQDIISTKGKRKYIQQNRVQKECNGKKNGKKDEKSKRFLQEGVKQSNGRKNVKKDEKSKRFLQEGVKEQEIDFYQDFIGDNQIDRKIGSVPEASDQFDSSDSTYTFSRKPINKGKKRNILKLKDESQRQFDLSTSKSQTYQTPKRQPTLINDISNNVHSNPINTNRDRERNTVYRNKTSQQLYNDKSQQHKKGIKSQNRNKKYTKDDFFSLSLDTYNEMLRSPESNQLVHISGDRNSFLYYFRESYIQDSEKKRKEIRAQLLQVGNMRDKRWIINQVLVKVLEQWMHLDLIQSQLDSQIQQQLRVEETTSDHIDQEQVLNSNQMIKKIKKDVLQNDGQRRQKQDRKEQRESLQLVIDGEKISQNMGNGFDELKPSQQNRQRQLTDQRSVQLSDKKSILIDKELIRNKIDGMQRIQLLNDAQQDFNVVKDQMDALTVEQIQLNRIMSEMQKNHQYLTEQLINKELLLSRLVDEFEKDSQMIKQLQFNYDHLSKQLRQLLSNIETLKKQYQLLNQLITNNQPIIFQQFTSYQSLNQSAFKHLTIEIFDLCYLNLQIAIRLSSKQVSTKKQQHKNSNNLNYQYIQQTSKRLLQIIYDHLLSRPYLFNQCQSQLTPTDHHNHLLFNQCQSQLTPTDHHNHLLFNQCQSQLTPTDHHKNQEVFSFSQLKIVILHIIQSIIQQGSVIPYGRNQIQPQTSLFTKNDSLIDLLVTHQNFNLPILINKLYNQYVSQPQFYQYLLQPLYQSLQLYTRIFICINIHILSHQTNKKQHKYQLNHHHQKCTSLIKWVTEQVSTNSYHSIKNKDKFLNFSPQFIHFFQIIFYQILNSLQQLNYPNSDQSPTNIKNTNPNKIPISVLAQTFYQLFSSPQNHKPPNQSKFSSEIFLNYLSQIYIPK